MYDAAEIVPRVLQSLHRAVANEHFCRDARRGRHLVFYVIFISIYIVTVILQRNPRDSQTMQQAMQMHLGETTYVDPYSFELKAFKDTATVEDMWHWLQVGAGK